MSRNRRLTVIVFSLFFSWLLAFPFEGQVLYAVADYHGVSARSLVFGAMVAHLLGLLACGFFVKSMRAAKTLILCSIAFCVVATSAFFFPPSLLWTVALFTAAFLVGCSVAAWGYYFKACTLREERMKTMADGLIFSNLLMILLNTVAIYGSPRAGLGFSVAVLAAAFLFSLGLPGKEHSSALVTPALPEQGVVSVRKFSVFAFLCLFIVVITINSGLMYQVVNPAFSRMELLTSLYWALPYIAALLIMRNLPRKTNRSYILYVAIAMIGFSFILFLVLGRLWPDYLVVITLMMGAFGVYDLFWWSILGDMLELDNNPASVIGIGLAANVFGVLLGELIGNAINVTGGSAQSHTLLALGVVCVTLMMLPPLHNRLAELLKSSFYLTIAAIPEREQARILTELDLPQQLTAREREVMSLLIRGKTYKVIARELFISENTIASHARNIYAKAGVANRVELMDLFLNS